MEQHPTSSSQCEQHVRTQFKKHQQNLSDHYKGFQL